MRPRRRRRSRPPAKHLTISATDGEWETVRYFAELKGLSIARYLVDLVRRDAAGRNDGPPLALDDNEQVEILERLRQASALFDADGSAQSLIADMQVRIAAMFTLWARDRIDRGRGDELREELVRIVGEDQAAAVMASLATSRPRRPRRRADDDPELDLFS